MKRLGRIVMAMAVCAVVITSIGGCEEQNLLATKKHRLIADENIQLEKELELCNKEIETQKELHKKNIEEQKELHDKQMEKQSERLDKEIERQRKLFAIRLLERTPSEEQMQKELQSLMESTLSDFEEIIKLREENKKLKAQIEELGK